MAKQESKKQESTEVFVVSSKEMLEALAHIGVPVADREGALKVSVGNYKLPESGDVKVQVYEVITSPAPKPAPAKPVTGGKK